jgi:hypothetical protein
MTGQPGPEIEVKSFLEPLQGVVDHEDVRWGLVKHSPGAHNPKGEAALSFLCIVKRGDDSLPSAIFYPTDSYKFQFRRGLADNAI